MKAAAVHNGKEQVAEAWLTPERGAGDIYAKLDGEWYAVNGRSGIVTDIRWKVVHPMTIAELDVLHRDSTPAAGMARDAALKRAFASSKFKVAYVDRHGSKCVTERWTTGTLAELAIEFENNGCKIESISKM